jgi:nucleoside 2-deoxyribosyltransferase
MNRRVYLAGPISGLDWQGATDWRFHAKQRLAQFSIDGMSPMRAKEFLKDVRSFSPTCDSEGSHNALAKPRGIMTRDRYDATTCDVLLVNFLGAQSVSIGTVMEIAWADLKRTPIVCACEDDGNPHMHAMISEALGYRVPTLDEAIDIVISILKA